MELDKDTHCVQSAFTHLGLWRKLYDCPWHHLRAIKCVIKRILSTFSSIFNSSFAIWKEDFSTPSLEHGGSVTGSFHSPHMGPISSPSTHMVYILPLLCYSAGTKAFPFVRPSDPDMKTNTDLLEAVALSNDKKDMPFFSSAVNNSSQIPHQNDQFVQVTDP